MKNSYIKIQKEPHTAYGTQKHTIPFHSQYTIAQVCTLSAPNLYILADFTFLFTFHVSRIAWQ